MDTLTLPLLSVNASVSPSAAFGLLRARQRGGLILQGQNDCRLLDAASLMQAKANGIAELGQITAPSVLLLKNAHAISHRVDLVCPTATANEYHALFDKVQSNFAIAGLTSDTAFVVTHFKGDAAALIGGVFQCNGSPRHTFPMPRVVVGQVCPNWPECDVNGQKSIIEAV